MAKVKNPETKKIAILVKGKTDLVTRDVIQSEGVLLQYASHASYQEATNNHFYEWLLDEEEGTYPPPQDSMWAHFRKCLSNIIVGNNVFYDPSLIPYKGFPFS